MFELLLSMLLKRRKILDMHKRYGVRHLIWTHFNCSNENTGFYIWKLSLSSLKIISCDIIKQGF